MGDIVLNEKQKKFCREYVKDLNATQAAIRAGYSKRTGYSMGGQLLKKIEIQEYISKLRKKEQSAAVATYDEICETLTRIIRGEDMDERYYTEDKVLVKRTIKSQNNRLKAIETLAKLKGYVPDEKLVVNNNVSVSTTANDINVDDLSPEQINKMIEEIKNK